MVVWRRLNNTKESHNLKIWFIFIIFFLVVVPLSFRDISMIKNHHVQHFHVYFMVAFSCDRVTTSAFGVYRDRIKQHGACWKQLNKYSQVRAVLNKD